MEPFSSAASRDGAGGLPPGAGPAYRFDTFLVEPVERRLLCGGQPLDILPKAFDVLLVLVRRPGQLVRKAELLEEVWPEVVVEENYLAVTISRLRAALGDDAHSPRYVETVPRYGYRFLAEVEIVTGAAHEVPYRAFAEMERTAQVASRGSSDTSETGVTRRSHRGRPARRVLWGGALATVLVAGVLWASFLRPTTPEAIGLAGSPRALAERAAPRPDVHPGATEAARAAYRRGRAIWWRRGDLRPALAQFRLAVTLDSTLALGWVGIADVYAFGYGTWAEARGALEKAFALDPDLGEAHATLGFVRAFQAWDWEGAEAAISRSVALTPEYVPARQWRATLLMVHRRFDEAVAELRYALTLAPHTPSLYADLCQSFYYRRAFDEALAACSRALELDPQFAPAQGYGFRAHLLRGGADDALRWAAQRGLFRSLVKQEQRSEAVESDGAAFLRAYAAHLSVSDAPGQLFNLALVQAVLGEREAALEALEQAVAIRQFLVPFANAEPAFDGLRGDPRFQALMQRVGLAG